MSLLWTVPRPERLVENIGNLEMRLFTEQALHHFWVYLWMPSTKGGGWHPRDEYRPGGNYLHVSRVLRVLEHLLRDDEGNEHNPWPKLTEEEQDIRRVAVILHDINKITTKGRVSTGPNIIMTEFSRQYGRGWAKAHPWAETVVELVAVHGGAFYKDAEVNKRTIRYDPQNKLHRLVHLADFIASRNDIMVDFEAPFGVRNRRSRTEQKAMMRVVKWLAQRNTLNESKEQ